jgi:hypothetical protein
MPLPRIVYKTRENNSDGTDVLPGDNDQWPVLSDEALDVIAAALAELHAELRAELRGDIQTAIDKAITELRGERDLHHAIAELRGQLTAVMNLVGNGNGVKLFEAEQTIRKVKMSTGES